MFIIFYYDFRKIPYLDLRFITCLFRQKHGKNWQSCLLSRLHKIMNNEYFKNFLFDNLFYIYEVSSPKIWFRLELFKFRVLIFTLQISLVKHEMN